VLVRGHYQNKGARGDSQSLLKIFVEMLHKLLWMMLFGPFWIFFSSPPLGMMKIAATQRFQKVLVIHLRYFILFFLKVKLDGIFRGSHPPPPPPNKIINLKPQTLE
jgi:hypothetical protein